MTDNGKRPRRRCNPRDEAAQHNQEHGTRPTDGYGWQRWARVQAIPANIARACRVEPQTAKFVYVLLSTYLGPDGTCDPGQATLRAQLGGMAERTLRRALDALEAAGLLDVERHRKGIDPRTSKPYTNRYTFVFKGAATVMAHASHTGHSHGRPMGTGHDDGRSGTGHGHRGDRPRHGEGPATGAGVTGHSYGQQTGRDERSSERSSKRAREREGLRGEGTEEAPARSSATEATAASRNVGTTAPETHSRGPATATADPSAAEVIALACTDPEGAKNVQEARDAGDREEDIAHVLLLASAENIHVVGDDNLHKRFREMARELRIAA